jgi:hypothetical protein
MKLPDRRQFLYLAGLGGAAAVGGAAAWLAAQARQYGRERALQLQVLRFQAEGVADKIGQFIKEIEAQLAWTTELPLWFPDCRDRDRSKTPVCEEWSPAAIEQRRSDALRLLRHSSAITEVSQLDSSGKKQFKVSRLVEFFDDPDFSQEFAVAMAKGVYYGPVYLRRQWPYMTLALARTQRDAGVNVAEIDVKFVCDMVAGVKIGQAYVIDAQGRLIAHPDVSMVLRNTNMMHFAHARAGESTDIYGHDVIIAYAPVVPLEWLVFVELPLPPFAVTPKSKTP